MTVLSWAMLILAAMIGAFLFATIGALVLALLLAQVSDRLAHNDEHRNY
jgi:integral membrane sensor domain MASE1